MHPMWVQTADTAWSRPFLVAMHRELVAVHLEDARLAAAKLRSGSRLRPREPVAHESLRVGALLLGADQDEPSIEAPLPGGSRPIFAPVRLAPTTTKSDPGSRSSALEPPPQRQGPHQKAPERRHVRRAVALEAPG
jgi:hypothetical protein